MRNIYRRVWMVLVASALLSLPINAQIKIGDLSASMSGVVAPGFSATTGSAAGSSAHNWGYGGSATLSGAYYNPNFISYNSSFYINQSKLNSTYQSTSNASGVNFLSTLFGGSHFPGSVSYTKAYDSEGSYNVPGIANYVTHGNSDSLGLGWSEFLPNLPSLTATYLRNSNSYDVYGSSASGTSHSTTAMLHSSYSIAGFGMSGYYNHGNGNSTIPPIIAATTIHTDSNSNAVGFNLSHRLPLNGAAAVNFNRSSWQSNVEGDTTSGTVDTINLNGAVHPSQKISVSAGLSWSDNLSGQLAQAIQGAGGVVTSVSDTSSNSLDLTVSSSYTVAKNLQTSAYFERRTQSYEGLDYSLSSYGAGIVTAHRVPTGSLNAAITMVGNFAGTSGSDSLGINASGNYNGVIRDWHINLQMSYSQNVQTLLVTTTNSFYNASGNVRKNWGRWMLGLGAAGSHTGLSDDAGVSSESQSYNATLGYSKYITATGSYSKSDGSALLTGAGLTGATQNTLTSLTSLYGGNSYSASLASSPIRNLMISASYVKALTNTQSYTSSSSNDMSQYNVYMTYQVRKMYLTTGYDRLMQGFSSTGSQPQLLYSYYAGVSRWFKFF